MISFWEKDGGMREEYFSFFLKHNVLLLEVYFYLNNVTKNNVERKGEQCRD